MNRSRTSRTAQPLLWLVVVVMLAGCASATTQPQVSFEDAPGAGEVDELVAELTYPDSEHAGFTAIAERRHAELTDECIRANGVDIPPLEGVPGGEYLPLPQVTPLEAWAASGDSFGVADALNGARSLEQVQAASTIPNDPRELPAEYDDVRYGQSPERVTHTMDGGWEVTVAVSGCFGEVTEQLYGVPAAQFHQAEYSRPHLAAVMPAVLAADGVGEAVEEWSQCMRDAGHRVDDPEQLAIQVSRKVEDTVHGSTSVEQLAQFESQITADDAGCKQDPGLDSAFADAFVPIAQEAVDASRAAMDDYRGMIDHARDQLDLD